MNHLDYRRAKIQLKIHADYMKSISDDTGLIRMEINDEVDRLSKSLFKPYSFERVEMYRNWLSSYAIKLHPKQGSQ